MSDSLLTALAREELGSVVFVRDYLQLDFSTARFAVFVWPTVRADDVVHRPGDPGYRDALCALIGRQVTATGESVETGLVIQFGSAELVTNPDPSELCGPEIAMLTVDEGPFQAAGWAVWRPGEDTFAGPAWS